MVLPTDQMKLPSFTQVFGYFLLKDNQPIQEIALQRLGNHTQDPLPANQFHDPEDKKRCQQTHQTTRAFPRRWQKWEDAKLARAVPICLHSGKVNWEEVAFVVGNDRSRDQCRQRYIRFLDPKIRKTEWTREEDKTLLLAIKIFGNNWKEIKKHLLGRTYLQCQSRYNKLKKCSL